MYIRKDKYTYRKIPMTMAELQLLQAMIRGTSSDDLKTREMILKLDYKVKWLIGLWEKYRPMIQVKINSEKVRRKP